MIEEVKDTFMERKRSVNLTAKKRGGLTCECPVCFEFLLQPVKLNCKHLFCLDCTKRLLKDKVKKCPMCRQKLKIIQPKLYQMQVEVDMLVNIDYR
jgi:hypothetical protein